RRAIVEDSRDAVNRRIDRRSPRRARRRGETLDAKRRGDHWKNWRSVRPSLLKVRATSFENFVMPCSIERATSSAFVDVGASGEAFSDPFVDVFGDSLAEVVAGVIGRALWGALAAGSDGPRASVRSRIAGAGCTS